MDVFIQKLDAAGNLLWVKQLGGSSYVAGLCITTDINGSVYTTGYFEETADFDPGTGTTNLTSHGNSDIFIQKLDAAGNLIWAKQIDGTGYDQALSIIIDAKDNLYTMGSFQGTADFDPFAGTTNLTSNGYFDAFVLKLSLNTTVGISENTFT
jgi:hypothetical protein